MPKILKGLHRLKRWFQFVLPPAWSIAIFAVTWAILEIMLFFIYSHATKDVIWAKSDRETFERQLAVSRAAIVFFGLGAFGCYRALFFSPWNWDGYREWLLATPWTSSKPLPLGPIHLVVQDLLVVGIVWLLCPSSEYMTIAWLTVPFFVPYILSLVLSFPEVAENQKFGVGFLLAMAAWFGLGSMASVAVFVFVYLLGLIGLQKTLLEISRSRFTPATRSDFPSSDFATSEMNKVNKQLKLGFPFDAIGPKVQADFFTPRRATLIPWLIAVWLFVVATRFAPSDERMLICHKFSSIMLVGASSIRAAVYLSSHRPPISFLGRLVTGRWILFRYDRGFLPSTIVLLMVAIELALVNLSIAGPGTCLLIFGVAGTVVLGMPPSLRQSFLTGTHRIAEPLFADNELIKV